MKKLLSLSILFFLLFPLSFASNDQNLGFEMGNMSNWLVGYESGGSDYTTITSQNFSSEGNYSAYLGGVHGKLLLINTHLIFINHTSIAINNTDMVCLDLHKRGNSINSWKLFSWAASKNFKLNIDDGNYTDLCVNSTSSGKLDVRIQGTLGGGSCNDPDVCNGQFFVDNIRVYTCSDGLKNGDETDVDCGSRCSDCIAAKSCSAGSDCTSGSCSSGICTAPTHCSNEVLDSGEEETDCGSICGISCDQYLLEKYAPILYFHPDEQFFPTTIEAMLNESDLKNSTVFFDETLDEMPVEENNLSQAKNTTYLDMVNASGGNLPTVPDGDRFSKYQKNVYGRKTSQSNFTILQYWFFYPYNHFNGGHEGDWEMIQIILNSSTKEPITSTYSYHYEARTYNWTDIGKVNSTHPKVFVALGGHASYKNSSSIWKLNFLENIVNETETIFSPKSLSHTYNLTTLQNNESWTNFSGRWGEIDINSIYSGPNSPANIAYGDQPNRWNDPLGFSEDSVPTQITATTGSPVNLHIYDEEGNHVGPNSSGQIEFGIPNVYLYNSSADGKESFIILSYVNLRFVVNSTGAGLFNLSITAFNSTSSSGIELFYQDINITNQTITSFNFTQQNPSFILQIDADGDGDIDSSLKPNTTSVQGNFTRSSNDSDEDGYSNSIDNCPSYYNPSQINDSDNDGYKSTSCGGTDCNDNSSSINPAAQETCNGMDDNCDGTTDPSCESSTTRSSGGGGGKAPTTLKYCQEESCKEKTEAEKEIEETSESQEPTFDYLTLSEERLSTLPAFDRLELLGLCFDGRNHSSIGLACGLSLKNTPKPPPIPSITGFATQTEKSEISLSNMWKSFKQFLKSIFSSSE